MNNVIVGTAGHVDHGKTCLIKALTGIETDRLAEEKKRGITIELGFADMQNAGDVHIGIIDVPGHERFIRNMLAGIGGIDIVLLVIAGDEGVMPQTLEHFEILKMLNIPKGIIVITKTDLCEEDWLYLIREDIKDTIENSFLENAPIIEVSVFTEENIDVLKNKICELADETVARKTEPSLLRIPIDRVFTIDGFGTVITGTLMEGTIRVGDEVEIYPKLTSAKVRTLQVHGKKVEEAYAGQRTAVNLSGIKKEEVEKGQTLGAKNSMLKTMMIDVKLEMFKDSPRELNNGSRLHLYYGSKEVLCKAILLGCDKLKSGECVYAQLRLEEEISVKKGDRFIIRFYSPVETIGGGIVLDASPKKHKRSNDKILKALQIKETGSDIEILEQIMKEESGKLFTIKEYGMKLAWTAENIEKAIDVLVIGKKALKVSEKIFVHVAYVKILKCKAEDILKEFHRKNPVGEGMLKEEFRKKLGEAMFLKDTKQIDQLTRILINEKSISEKDNVFSHSDFKISFTEEQKAIKSRIEEIYFKAGFEIPATDNVLLSEKDKKQAKQVHDSMINQSILYRINNQNCIHRDYWEKAVVILKEEILKNRSITLAQYRDLLGVSRKYAVMYLEHMDSIKLTAKVDDVRVLITHNL